MRVVNTDRIINEIAIRKNISKEDSNTYNVVIPACSNRRYGITLPCNKTMYGNNKFYFFNDWIDADDYLKMNSFMMSDDGVSYTVRYRFHRGGFKMSKINLESICKELGLDLTGDVFVAVNPVNLTITHVYINAKHGVINAVSQEDKLKCISNELFGEEDSK